MTGGGDPVDERPVLVCTATVRLVVEVELRRPWPERSTLEEVYRIAEREAVEKVRRLDGHPFSLVGKPFVQVVTSRQGSGL